MGMLGSLVLLLIKTLMNVWDVLTNWIYDMVTRPGEKLKNYDRVLAFPEKTIQENDTEVSVLILMRFSCVLHLFKS